MDEPKSSSQGTDGGNNQDRPLAWTRILSKQPSQRKYKYLDEDESQFPPPIPITINKPGFIGWDRVVELFLTAVIAYASSVQLYTVIDNNKSTSKQAERLLQSADRIDDAADSFSGSASHINEGVADAVTKLDAQAKKMDETRLSAQKNANDALQATIGIARTDQRAYLVVPYGAEPLAARCSGPRRGPLSVPQVDPRDTICATVSYNNVGRTPAVDIHPYGIFAYGTPPYPGRIDYEHLTEGITAEKVVANGDKGSLNIPVPTTINPANQHFLGAYVYGVIRYKDIFGVQRATGFCHFYPTEAASTRCGDGDWFDDEPGKPKPPNK